MIYLHLQLNYDCGLILLTISNAYTVYTAYYRPMQSEEAIFSVIADVASALNSITGP